MTWFFNMELAAVFTLLCLLYTTLPINHLYVPNAQENSISKAQRPSVRYVFFTYRCAGIRKDGFVTFYVHSCFKFTDSCLLLVDGLTTADQGW